jgi:pimeloyl-ACP methyl ester carboxylesterase
MLDVETRTVKAAHLTFAYEAFGSADDPPVLLIMGLATQMIGWPDAMCEELARRGHWVVRFDNRDAGLSTHLSHLPTPTLRDLALHSRRPPYTIDDMADDTAALLEALGLDDAHIVGASMGGFIAQTLAVRHPTRVRSLTLFMTSTGSRLVGWPHPRIVQQLGRRRAVASRSAAVDAVVETFRLIGSRGFAFDEAYLRDVAGRSYDRAFDPDGYLRQLAACVGQRDRSRQLCRVQVPTAVLHGLHDPLVHVSGGLSLARHIPGSRFVGFTGMGHDLPRPLWPQFVDEIASVTAQGEARRRGDPPLGS